MFFFCISYQEMIEKWVRIGYNTIMERSESGKSWYLFRTDHIGVLDGIRAVAILVVLWFHFWQQTWLMPYYPTPFLSAFGIDSIDLNPLRRCGYLCVDWMILLSGFVLFLPYARHRFEGTPLPSAGTFYRKRLARIVPSYLFAVLVMFFLSLSEGGYAGRTDFLWRDLITHLTFTFLFRADTYLFSGINGVFWTVAIEVMFYAIFPLLAFAFRKRPLWTYLVMVAAGFAFTFAFCLRQSDLAFYVNRFLTFFPVFANGMLGAYLYVAFVNKAPWKPLFAWIGTAVAVASAVGIWLLFEACTHTKSIQTFQLTYRYPLSLLYLGVTIGMCVSARPIRTLLSNRVLGAIAAVSYNLYLWHQYIVVRLRIALGCKSGADVAALGAQTQWMLTVEALVIALGWATLITYLLERPLHRLLAGRTLRIHS